MIKEENKTRVGYIAGIAIILAGLFMNSAYAGTLSCTVAASCPTGTIIYRMSDTDNAHAEIASQSNYSQLVCCTGVASMSNSCSGTFAIALDLSATTNAHAEENSQTNYATNACLSVPSGGTVSVAYQASNCTGFDTTLGSISGTTNAHVGDATAYTTKVCATATGVTQTLTFSISDNSIGFGTLNPSAAQYATGDTNGSAADSVDAHTISASTNASSGYVLQVNGSTLTCAACGGATVTAIGGTALASSAGSEQFGLRAVVNSGTGSVSTPYNGANWAFDTAAFPDQVGSGSGDESVSVFGLRYLGNISASTETGSYSAVITYTMTASF